MRILIVEDQAELRQALARQLRRFGHGVDEAGDLETAQLQIRTHEFSVLILDRTLPDGDGADRLRVWRAPGF